MNVRNDLPEVIKSNTAFSEIQKLQNSHQRFDANISVIDFFNKKDVEALLKVPGVQVVN
ncbi:hypothetical protein D3C83_288350 [compost metagenome]